MRPVFTAAIAVLVLVVLSPIAHSAPVRLPEPFDRTYGIYLNGSKVGWMRSTLKVGKQVEQGTELQAAVTGMGDTSKVTLTESRSYDVASGQLTTISFSQQAAAGGVKVTGQVTKGRVALTIEAGQATQRQTFAVNDTLQDALAVDRLVAQGKVGASLTVHHFDASMQKQVTMLHTVTSAEDRVLAGVTTKVYGITTKYPELGIEEQAFVDAAGTVLESRVGGFFVARLEPPDVAKKLDYAQDLLVSAVVKPPQPIAKPTEQGRILVTFTGFGGTLPPQGPRQVAVARGDSVELTLTKDTPIAATDVRANAQEARKQGLSEFLSPTPFIQSDAPAIRKAAEQAAAGASEVSLLNQRLIEFVYRYVRDAYVPAYSNALDALTSARGDCTEHSILYVALARAMGVPARVAVGIAYWPPGDGFGWHAWAEIWVAGRWVTVDPTWNQPIADATHVKLADGDPAEQARIVMLLGRLRISTVTTAPQK